MATKRTASNDDFAPPSQRIKLSAEVVNSILADMLCDAEAHARRLPLLLLNQPTTYAQVPKEFDSVWKNLMVELRSARLLLADSEANVQTKQASTLLPESQKETGSLLPTV